MRIKWNKMPSVMINNLKKKKEVVLWSGLFNGGVTVSIHIVTCNFVFILCEARNISSLTKMLFLFYCCRRRRCCCRLTELHIRNSFSYIHTQIFNWCNPICFLIFILPSNSYFFGLTFIVFIFRSIEPSFFFFFFQ